MSNWTPLLGLLAMFAFGIWYDRRVDLKHKAQLERVTELLECAESAARGEVAGTVRYVVERWGRGWALRKQVMQFTEGVIVAEYNGDEGHRLAEAEAARLNAASHPAPPEVAS